MPERKTMGTCMWSCSSWHDIEAQAFVHPRVQCLKCKHLQSGLLKKHTCACPHMPICQRFIPKETTASCERGVFVSFVSGGELVCWKLKGEDRVRWKWWVHEHGLQLGLAARLLVTIKHLPLGWDEQEGGSKSTVSSLHCDGYNKSLVLWQSPVCVVLYNMRLLLSTKNEMRTFSCKRWLSCISALSVTISRFLRLRGRGNGGSALQTRNFHFLRDILFLHGAWWSLTACDSSDQLCDIAALLISEGSTLRWTCQWAGMHSVSTLKLMLNPKYEAEHWKPKVWQEVVGVVQSQ